MRSSSLVSLASGLLLLLPARGTAQQRGPIRVDQIRTGFLTTAAEGRFKAGAWTPVYVDVTAGPAGFARGELLVESVDSDDVRNRFRVPMPSLDPNEAVTVLTYTRPGSGNPEIATTIQIDGRTVAGRQDTPIALRLGQQLFLTVGSNLPGLRRALSPSPKQNEEEAFNDAGPRQVTRVDAIGLLPNRWFAYEPVDLLLLCTGNRDFLMDLLNDRQGRKEALAEWVRRGGRLVVSVGRNQDVVSRLEPIASLLPVAITGTIPQGERLTAVELFAGSKTEHFRNPASRTDAAGSSIEIARLERKPGRDLTLLIPSQRQGSDEPLVAVTGAYGRGQVTVVAFDLDERPFTAWEGQAAFWNKFLEKTVPQPPPEENPRRRGAEDSEDIATQLEKQLEDFEDVPVISFGWVALFILLYILVVGPLDYFFLKKVVKRLELTWITFPTVVLTISVAAYFTAYALKGNDQKINKIDLVDIDLHTQQLYGDTWFTIFSPRIQHYTIGLEPSAPDWVPAAAAGQQNPPVMLTWLGRPEVGWGGSSRPHSQGLFRRAYDYVGDAVALTGVPIQVWSTKSFTAAWQGAFDPARPAVQADLHHPPGSSGGAGENKISGTITSHLPVALEDVVVYHATGWEGKWYALDRLLPGVPNRVDNRLVSSEGIDLNQWAGLASRLRPGQATPASGRSTTASLMAQILFFKPSSSVRNTTLRSLDQYWRLGHKDEVIVLGRVARADGQAEQVSASAASPSRLWLGALPAAGQARPPLLGTLAQETYVRIFIPVP